MVKNLHYSISKNECTVWNYFNASNIALEIKHYYIDNGKWMKRVDKYTEEQFTAFNDIFNIMEMSGEFIEIINSFRGVY